MQAPIPPAEGNADVRAQYEGAIESLLAKAKADPYVLAIVLVGSLSHDVVWEKSDIDLLIVTQETRQKTSGLTLVESGLNIHATLINRAEFKKRMEGAIESSFLHSLLMKGRLIYTRDETLHDLWNRRDQFGVRDREIRAFEAAAVVTVALPKAQKWLHVKNDPHYSFFWIMKCLDYLATIETVLAGEITGREVVWQALRHNPAFFQAVYTDLIDGPKTPETIGAALARIEGYLKERALRVFRPVLDYLAETSAARSASEIDHHFKNHFGIDSASMACEWLADEGYIQKVAAPVRLTEKSRVDMEEAAYYYDPTTD